APAAPRRVHAREAVVVVSAVRTAVGPAIVQGAQHAHLMATGRSHRRQLPEPSAAQSRRPQRPRSAAALTWSRLPRDPAPISDPSTACLTTAETGETRRGTPS